MNDEVIDIEHSARKGKCQPKGKRYKIKVDKQKFLVEKETITGLKILELAQKTPPDRYQLNHKFKGGCVESVSLTDEVDLTAPGVEKFMTIPLDQIGGQHESRFSTTSM